MPVPPAQSGRRADHRPEELGRLFLGNDLRRALGGLARPVPSRFWCRRVDRFCVGVAASSPGFFALGRAHLEGVMWAPMPRLYHTDRRNPGSNLPLPNRIFVTGERDARHIQFLGRYGTRCVARAGFPPPLRFRPGQAAPRTQSTCADASEARSGAGAPGTLGRGRLSHIRRHESWPAEASRRAAGSGP